MASTTSRKTSGPPKWAVNAISPVALAISGRRWLPLYAVLHHRGRKSGREYAIPVALVPTRSPDIFLIGLPWGVKTNWALNVLAAGGATVTWKGRDWVATEPRIVGTEIAVAQARGLVRPIVGSGRFPGFMELKRQS